MDNKPTLTDDEQVEVGRAMLTAALEALGEFPDNVDEKAQNEIALRVVRALAAAATVEKAETKRLSEVKGDLVYVETEAHEVVATAFWMCAEEPDLAASDVHPRCAAGLLYLSLAQGLAAALAMTEALEILQYGSMLAFASQGALRLAPKDEAA